MYNKYFIKFLNIQLKTLEKKSNDFIKNYIRILEKKSKIKTFFLI